MTTPDAETPVVEAEPNAADSPAQDPAAEVARLKAELAKARKWEDRAKANATAAQELEALRQQSMTEQERAVAEARAAARSEALAEVAQDRVADAIRAAAANRTVDIDALIEGVNVARFHDEHGQPKRDDIVAWLDKVAPAPNPDGRPHVPDLGQGARGGQALALNGDPLENALRTAVGAKR